MLNWDIAYPPRHFSDLRFDVAGFAAPFLCAQDNVGAHYDSWIYCAFQ